MAVQVSHDDSVFYGGLNEMERDGLIRGGGGGGGGGGGEG